MKKNKELLFFSLIFVGLYSCTTENNEPCNIQVAISTLSTPSQPCSASGTIQITEPIGANYQYKIDSYPFQNQPIFSNVKVGNHVLVLKDQNGCETFKKVIVDTIVVNNTFNQVRQILANRCSSCHSGNNPHAGLDFTNVCDILNHWQRIEARAVQGIPTPMPQAGFIPQAERNIIIEWIINGHSYSN
jgi:hypothetical protein